jgi:hypothetical protein
MSIDKDPIPDKSKHADDIKNSIKELEKELETIQKDCLHAQYEIKNCPSNTSSFSLKKVCKKCSKEIGYPSQDEVDKWANR